MTDANSTVGTLACLSSLALISVSGADRFTFLQGQLTNDVTKLGDSLMTAGYCSPKGRLLATPRLFQMGEAVGMIVAASNAEYLVKRLKMYVLRSKVTVELAADREIAGFIGKAPAGLPADALVFELPCARPEARIAAALPEGLGLAVLAKGSVACGCSEALWWAACAAAGEPWVFAETAERFTPHAVNLDLAHGVSFSKGCYTGQEVVSRIEHIGKTNRRTALFAINKPVELPPGTDLKDEAGNAVATVVYASALADRTLLLAEVSAELAQSGAALTTDTGELHRLPLPYGWTRTE